MKTPEELREEEELRYSEKHKKIKEIESELEIITAEAIKTDSINSKEGRILYFPVIQDSASKKIIKEYFMRHKWHCDIEPISTNHGNTYELHLTPIEKLE